MNQAGRKAQGDSGHSAQQGKTHRLGEELQADLVSGGAQGSAEADLLAASSTEMTMIG
jgi:hypothetical protein